MKCGGLRGCFFEAIYLFLLDMQHSLGHGAHTHAYGSPLPLYWNAVYRQIQRMVLAAALVPPPIFSPSSGPIQPRHRTSSHLGGALIEMKEERVKVPGY